VFGRPRKDQPEPAAREAERQELFAALAARPDTVCPFLGLEGDRAGYIHGVSDDHRCFAFGDPAAITAEQQTRVCQERGYGNCPRYLRGVLVIPTEELQALRRPHAAEPLTPVSALREEEGRPRRRGAPILAGVLAILLIAGVATGLVFSGIIDPGAATGSSSPEPSVGASAPVTLPSPAASESPAGSVAASELATPTPEPTPDVGDTFAFYEVSVGPTEYRLYRLGDDGAVEETRLTGFAQFSYAQAEPRRADDGEVYWVTLDGGLVGWAYRYPDSGEFRVRAVFLDAEGERSSAYLPQDDLTLFPEATPAP
jgi:hypothetical protein